MPLVFQNYSLFSKDADTKIPQKLSDFSSGKNRKQKVLISILPESFGLHGVFEKIANVKIGNLT